MKEKRFLYTGFFLIGAFVFWTAAVMTIDVQSIGVNGTAIGFATLNSCFHKLTGVHMTLYYITDWLGLVPIFCCMALCGIGCAQLVKREKLFQVDCDIIALGIYYLTVMLAYLLFEMIPINYRPILIDGVMEASYPSSTTLLVLSVMPTVFFQANRRVKRVAVKKTIMTATVLFSSFMVIARTLAGVHWLTDIAGSLLLSAGLFLIYYAIVLHLDKKQEGHRGV